MGGAGGAGCAPQDSGVRPVPIFWYDALGSAGTFEPGVGFVPNPLLETKASTDLSQVPAAPVPISAPVLGESYILGFIS